MALTWPTNFDNPPSFRVSPIHEGVRDQSPFTFAREVMPRVTLWHVEMEWLALPMDEYLAATAYFTRGDGGETLFQVPILASRVRRGSKSGTVTLNGAHGAGVSTLAITGGSGLFLQGDWFSIGTAANTPHAYLVVSSEAANAIQIKPGLRIAQSTGTQLVISSPIFDTMELATPTPTFAMIEVQPTPRYSHSLALEFVTAIRQSY